MDVLRLLFHHNGVKMNALKERMKIAFSMMVVMTDVACLITCLESSEKRNLIKEARRKTELSILIKYKAFTSCC